MGNSLYGRYKIFENNLVSINANFLIFPFPFSISYLLNPFPFSISSVLNNLRYFNTQSQWRLDTFSCKFLVPFSFYVLPLISCWMMVILSYERYRTITHPFIKRLAKRKYFAAICFMSAALFILYLDFMLRNKVTEAEGGEGSACIEIASHYTNTENTVHVVFERFLDCVFPVLLMLFFYNKIKHNFTKDSQSKTMIASHRYSNTARKRKENALQTLKYLLIVYVVCVFPGRLFGTIAYLVSIYNLTVFNKYLKILDPIYYVLLFACSLNNMVNVFVFLWMMPDFRRFVKRPCDTHANKHFDSRSVQQEQESLNIKTFTKRQLSYNSNC